MKVCITPLITLITILAIIAPSSVKAQLSDEQIEGLTEKEKLFNEFLVGFRIEEINGRIYNCLYE